MEASEAHIADGEHRRTARGRKGRPTGSKSVGRTWERSDERTTASGIERYAPVSGFRSEVSA